MKSVKLCVAWKYDFSRAEGEIVGERGKAHSMLTGPQGSALLAPLALLALSCCSLLMDNNISTGEAQGKRDRRCHALLTPTHIRTLLHATGLPLPFLAHVCLLRAKLSRDFDSCYFPLSAWCLDNNCIISNKSQERIVVAQGRKGGQFKCPLALPNAH